jgi:transcriptional regulator with XRE-family HTH domain
MSTLGSRIRHLRKERDMTQDQLAAIIHVNRATLANWEIDRATPDLATLQRLADFFNTTTDYLLGRTSDPAPPVLNDITPEELRHLEKRRRLAEKDKHVVDMVLDRLSGENEQAATKN